MSFIIKNPFQDYPPEERKALALKSQTWSCPSCGLISKLLKTEELNSTESEANKEAKELAKQIRFKVFITVKLTNFTND